MIQVVVVDDHPLFVKAVQRALGSCEGIEVVGAAFSVPDALRVVGETRPRVLILDVLLTPGDGFQVARRVADMTRVLFLSGYASPQLIKLAMDLKAWGYLLKTETDNARLVEAVRLVDAEYRILSPSVMQIAEAIGLQGFLEAGRSRRERRLSRREMEVTRQIADGKHRAEIADALDVGPATVKTLWERAQKKLGKHQASPHAVLPAVA